jgi:hypothetical protein
MTLGSASSAQQEDMIYPDNRQLQRHALNEALQGSRLFDVEFRIVPSSIANFRWHDIERGRDPVGRAIRSGETIYVQDFAADPEMAPGHQL